jgi:predicted porin
MKMRPLALALGLMFGTSEFALAADSTEVQALKQQMEVMQKQMAAMQEQLRAMNTAPQAEVPKPEPAAATSGLTAKVGGASVTLYGFADLSADVGNDGKHSVNQVSSNLSYVGVRGSKALGSTGLKGIFQVETLANISGTPTETGGLASRNSFVGLEGGFGKLMLGKSDTPYKRATAAMDPFASSVGDYNSIMGNTGGDLRAEFDSRLPHAIFYDSPKVQGFSVNAMYSPGQKFDNLANSDKYAFAQGEKICAGATPGSSGSLPDPGSTLCNDGAFKNAYSAAFNFEAGPVYVTLSYERHQAVDRTSDNGGVTSNESAAKLGASYNFGSNRLSGIYEKFYRGGGVVPDLNERARTGYYLSDVQELGQGFDLMGAWAHAAQTPGGPDFGSADDKANMYALGMKYHYDKQFALYLVGALLKQGAGGHYAMGAGGHGTAIASPRNDNGDTIPGQSIKALSAGMQYAF